MAAETKTKKAYYKRAVFQNDPGKTLQQLLVESIAKHKLPEQRKHVQAGFATSLTYALHHQGQKGYNVLGCEVMGFEPGGDTPVVGADPQAEQWKVRAVRPPNPTEDFIGGSAYLAVFENHVVILQSQQMRSQEVENYINWLLKISAKLIEGSNQLQLCDEPPRTGASANVRAIEFSQPVQLLAKDGDEEVGTKVVRGKSKKKQKKFEDLTFKPGGKGWDAIKAFLGDVLDIPASMKADSLLRKGNLEVAMRVQWKTRGDEETSEFMQNVSQQMRHVSDEVDYEVFTTDGSFTRNQFKQFSDFNCPWKDGRPAFDTIFPMFSDWLAGLIDSGKVTP